jgi:hypothetical protein
MMLYTLAEIRDGTGWEKGTKFAHLTPEEAASMAKCLRTAADTFRDSARGRNSPISLELKHQLERQAAWADALAIRFESL